jgi:hypothetical protein
MASPLASGKRTVDLAAKDVRVSKIRRDPPPLVKKTVVPDRDGSDRRLAAVGIIAFALAIVVLIIAIGSWAGWSPSQYTVRLKTY